MVGGLYGVAIGAAFFGESMFNTIPNASKVAFSRLVDILKYGNYLLLDTQFTNDHIRQFGVIEIPRHEYLDLLGRAIQQTGDFQVQFSSAKS